MEKKNPINRELNGREFKGNLPEGEASCLLLKRVRVQGFKGLWRRLTTSGQGQLLSALVLGSDKGLRASDESDNSNRPCSCPTVLGFLRKSGRTIAPKLQLERLVLAEFN